MDEVIQKLSKYDSMGLVILAIIADTKVSKDSCFSTRLPNLLLDLLCLSGKAKNLLLNQGMFLQIRTVIDKHGYGRVGRELVKQLKKQSLSENEIRNKINSYFMLSDKLKRKILKVL